MKVKLDENLGTSLAAILQEAGHDVQTVKWQGMPGVSDRELITHCRSETRCLVTLDLGFANPLVFDPADFPGIAVTRLSPRVTAAELQMATGTLAQALTQRDVAGQLWIVQGDRVRVFQAPVQD